MPDEYEPRPGERMHPSGKYQGEMDRQPNRCDRKRAEAKDRKNGR
jgi:hypothetical protein